MSYSVTGADGRSIAKDVTRSEAYEVAARVTNETGEEVTVSENVTAEDLFVLEDETIAPSVPKRRRKS